MPLVDYLPSDDVGLMCRVSKVALADVLGGDSEDGSVGSDTGIIISHLESFREPVFNVFLSNGSFWHFPPSDVEVIGSNVHQSIAYLEMLKIPGQDEGAVQRAKESLKGELMKHAPKTERVRGSKASG